MVNWDKRQGILFFPADIFRFHSRGERGWGCIHHPFFHDRGFFHLPSFLFGLFLWSALLTCIGSSRVEEYIWWGVNDSQGCTVHLLFTLFFHFFLPVQSGHLRIAGTSFSLTRYYIQLFFFLKKPPILWNRTINLSMNYLREGGDSWGIR